MLITEVGTGASFTGSYQQQTISELPLCLEYKNIGCSGLDCQMLKRRRR